MANTIPQTTDYASKVSGFANALGSYSGAVSDLMAASGSAASATSYDQAAVQAERNALLVQQGTEIQKTQEQRQMYKLYGAEEAGYGGAGVAKSGSALDILRSSHSQGSLTTAQTVQQGAIQETAYKDAAAKYRMMAEAARQQEKSQKEGALLSDVGTVVSIAALFL